MVIITTISIFIVAGFVWLINRILPFSVCPICAGVSGTWLWILAGIYLGILDVKNWQLVAAILTGGSVVGIAYRIEKQLSPSRSSLLWKTIFIPLGFAAVYGVLLRQWDTAFIFFALLLLISFIFLPRQKNKISNDAVERLKEKMKDCC